MKPSIGRIVHFLELNGRHRAAIISDVHSDTIVDLHIMQPSSETPVRLFVDAAFDEYGRNAYSWHWPEKV